MFFNDNIKVGNETMFIKKWVKRGACFVHNLLDEEGDFLSVEEFKTKYNLQTDYITYIGCVQAIKSYMRKLHIVVGNNRALAKPKILHIIASSPKGARRFYDFFMQNNGKPNCCYKWETKLNTTVKWKTTFKKIHQIKEIKLRWFQIRLVHRILATNTTLMYMNIINENTCSFCRRDHENIYHLFWACHFTHLFWTRLESFLSTHCENTKFLKLNERIILFGHDSTFRSDPTFDMIILHAKFYIYKCKINRAAPQFICFRRYLKQMYETQKHISVVNMTYNKFETNWFPYKQIVDV